MSIPPEKYRVREVDFSGHKWPIVLHARGGSSLLVALANAVLRAFDFRKAFKTEGGVRGRPKYVRTEVLFQILEMAVADRLQVLLRSKVIDEHAMVTAWKGCSDIIRLLPGDYSVDPIFTRFFFFSVFVLSIFYCIFYLTHIYDNIFSWVVPIIAAAKPLRIRIWKCCLVL